MKLNIRVNGATSIQNKFNLYRLKTIQKLKMQVVETGKEFRKTARRRAPKKTGQLRKSIVVKFNKEKTAAFIRATARYSHIVENGSASRGIAPRPFMQPAAEEIRPRFEAKVTDILRGNP